MTTLTLLTGPKDYDFKLVLESILTPTLVLESTKDGSLPELFMC